MNKSRRKKTWTWRLQLIQQILSFNNAFEIFGATIRLKYSSFRNQNYCLCRHDAISSKDQTYLEVAIFR